MNYQTFQPHPDLDSIVKFYWTLQVPYDPNNKKQKIIPDGCIEMTFNFKDGIKRYISDTEYIVHPCAMIMGQRTKSYNIEPIGDVDSFAICFYPYGFTNIVNIPLKNLTDIEVPISELFGEIQATELEKDIVGAKNTHERIDIIESFLFKRIHENSIIENIVKETVDTLIVVNGNKSINEILKDEPSMRRSLERKFLKQIGISPKQLGKVIRLQSAIKMMLNNEKENLTSIAYENDYFDQAHFTKDFRELTGINPKEFIHDENMTLSSLFYK